MASSGRGYLLILNVKQGRPGSEIDEENLCNIFTAMGADVDVEPNPTEKVVRSKMAELKIKDFTNYSYVAVAYFSHGTEDDVVSTANNRELINAQKLLLIPLCNNPTLDGKLKWLIMENCRGSYDFAKLKPEGPVPLIKYEKYYIKCFPTKPSMRAYRTREYGSFFIYHLCQRLEREYKDLDIISILENVKLDVEEECQDLEHFSVIQSPDVETNFKTSEKFFITSGFKDN